MSLLQCSISGEPLTAANGDEIVVTPSGHLCLKRLLLTKLSENGGVDPFSDSGRPLSEDQLVLLQTPQSKSATSTAADAAPPPASVSSFSGTLKQLANEYDAAVLELFDTRKALQETRRELSQALYQNDAAIRVVARLSMERDAARQESQRFQATTAGQQYSAANGSHPEVAEAAAAAAEAEQPPSQKKPRLEQPADDDDAQQQSLPLTNDIPSTDLQLLLDSWERLHQVRQSKPKSTATVSPPWTVVDTQSWHKSACRGITAMAYRESASNKKWIVTAGKDKQLVVYDTESQTVVTTVSTKSTTVSTVDVVAKEGATDADALWVVAGCGKEVRVYDSETRQLHGSCNMGDAVMHVAVHPSSKHCVAATKDGNLAILRMDNEGIQHLSTFAVAGEDNQYTCGALHPDGLIYAAGTHKGQTILWDFKNKVLAGTLPAEIEEEDAIVAMAFSHNGYHFATAHQSGAVCVWDLRKHKRIAQLNTGDDALQSVSAVSFHPDGKYLAYGGTGGVCLTQGKEWKILAHMTDVKVASTIVWAPEWIASCSDKGRTVTFLGPQPPQQEEE